MNRLEQEVNAVAGSIPVSRGIVGLAVAFTVALILVQFVVASRFEPIAQMVGIMDTQSKLLNTTYLDYEEQNAILRSSKFLVHEKATGYVPAPSKVLYVNPGEEVVSSND